MERDKFLYFMTGEQRACIRMNTVCLLDWYHTTRFFLLLLLPPSEEPSSVNEPSTYVVLLVLFLELGNPRFHFQQPTTSNIHTPSIQHFQKKPKIECVGWSKRMTFPLQVNLIQYSDWRYNHMKYGRIAKLFRICIKTQLNSLLVHCLIGLMSSDRGNC